MSCVDNKWIIYFMINQNISYSEDMALRQNSKFWFKTPEVCRWNFI